MGALDDGDDWTAGTEAIDVGVHEGDGAATVTVHDRIERGRFAVTVDAAPGPEAVEPATTRFPVEVAVRLRTGRIEVPQTTDVFVMAGVEESFGVEQGSRERFPAGEYALDLGAAPMKFYLELAGPLVVDNTDRDRTVVTTERGTVTVGVRSVHDSPAATVTAPPDVEGLATAVSALSSSLKATSPERAWPTTRGHPPRVELGSALDVPDRIEIPETGVRVEVPPRLEHVYPVAPLAFYLGGEVVPVADADPRLVVDDFEHPLGTRGDGDVERRVAETLRQVFVCDCVVRREGLLSFPLDVDGTVTGALPRSTADLFDADPAERLRAYLSVPFERLADAVPPWPVAAHVEPRPESAVALPYLLDELATVHVAPTAGECRQVGTSLGGIADGGERAVVHEGRDGQLRYGRLTETPDAKADAYVGDGTPVGATKAVAAAADSRVERSPAEGDTITVDVVCAEVGMAGEMVAASGVYSQSVRQELPFDVQVHTAPTVAEFRDLLEHDATFLHYVGHSDDAGLPCADGHLDARDLEAVGVEAFFLNACRSYDQAVALCERGAIAGVGSVADVGNDLATGVGKTVARFLNVGFPVRGALAWVKRLGEGADQYVVVGSGRHTVAQGMHRTPAFMEVAGTARASRTVALDVSSFAASDPGVGGAYQPCSVTGGTHFILPSDLRGIEVDYDRLRECFGETRGPVLVDGELRWNPEYTGEDLLG